MPTTTHRLHFDLDDQAVDRYPEVPFEVVGDSVEVTLAYDAGAAVVDLGCRDAERWRGWSGGARDRFVITATEATPGYEPGEMPADGWAVVLGLHAVPAEGVDVTITVTTPAEGRVEPEPEAPEQSDAPRGSHRGLPAPEGLRWYAGDFHSHSLHSDGSASLDQLAHRAAANGLDFLAVTEHNTVSHHPHLPGVGDRQGIHLLPGQEVTTARGHANAFGDIGWIDFRCPADGWEAQVGERGGLLSLNHPLEGDCSWQHPLTSLPPVLEMWHIGWFRDLASTAMWGLWDRWRKDASLVGGSDFHTPDQGYPPGTPTTWVAAADPSTDAILDAVRAGRTAMAWSSSPCPTLLRVDDEILALDADGTVLSDIAGRSRVLRGDRLSWPSESLGRGPFRLESNKGHLLAITP